MQKYVVLHKKVGETPLSAMETWREAVGLDTAVPLTYAGRLDPLASGALLVLIGEECKRKDYYLGLDKVYEFSILFGIGSDSGDVLGLPTAHNITTITQDTLTQLLRRYKDEITLPYPVFSSKPVAGKPLHTWAVEKRLNEITIPTKTSTIYNVKLIDTETVNRKEIYQQALGKIDSIPPVTELRKAMGNDFRREDIRAAWQTWYEATPADTVFTLAHCQAVCSSGTYVRSLATDVGTKCGSAALAFSIHRTKLGNYHPFGPLGYFSPSFSLNSAWRAK